MFVTLTSFNCFSSHESFVAPQSIWSRNLRVIVLAPVDWTRISFFWVTRVTDLEIHIIPIAWFLVIQLADIFNLKEETTASDLTRTKTVDNGLSESGLFIISAVLLSSIKFYALPLVLSSNSLFLYR